MNDPRLTGYLMRSLRYEMAAVQQYLTQSSLAALWHLEDYSAMFRNEAEEEMSHVQLVIDHMLKIGIAPNGLQLPPVRPGRSLQEMLAVDREFEVEVIGLYDEAKEYCGRLRLIDMHLLYDRLLRDELHHLAEIDRLLADVRSAGRA